MVVKTVEEMMADAREKWVVDVRKKEDFDRDHYPDFGNTGMSFQEIDRFIRFVTVDCRPMTWHRIYKMKDMRPIA